MDYLLSQLQKLFVALPFENCKMLMVSRMQFLPNFTEIQAINF